MKGKLVTLFVLLGSVGLLQAGSCSTCTSCCGDSKPAKIMKTESCDSCSVCKVCDGKLICSITYYIVEKDER